MPEDTARDDIAFIRRTIENGRRSAQRWSGTGIAWGLAISAALLATYLRRRWLTFDLDLLWHLCVGAAWLYTIWDLRRLGRSQPGPSLPARGLEALWLGSGLFLTSLAYAPLLAGQPAGVSMLPVMEGTLGLTAFVAAALCEAPRWRLLAAAWWLAEIATVALGNRAEANLVGAAALLLLLVAPSLALRRRRAP